MTLPNLLTWVDFNEDGYDTGATVIGANGVAIAVAMDTPYQDDFLQLIAAAPDLLAALEELCLAPNKHRPDEYWEAARVAIAKAKGE